MKFAFSGNSLPLLTAYFACLSQDVIVSFVSSAIFPSLPFCKADRSHCWSYRGRTGSFRSFSDGFLCRDSHSRFISASTRVRRAYGQWWDSATGCVDRRRCGDHTPQGHSRETIKNHARNVYCFQKLNRYICVGGTRAPPRARGARAPRSDSPAARRRGWNAW